MRSCALLGLLLTVACDGPAIELVVERPADLAADTALQVTVYAPSDAHSFDCGAIAYDDVPADVLQATQVMSAPLAGSEGRLVDVARVGHRLVVVRGFDSAGREVVRGCAAAEDVTRHLQLTVKCARTTTLSANLAQQLWVGAETPPLAEPAIGVNLLDSTGVPATGTVRVRVYGAAAALVSSAEQPVDPASAGGIRVSVETPGPFAVELRSKNAIAPQPVWLSGFVEPPHSVVPVQRESSSTVMHILQPTPTSVAFVTLDSAGVTFGFPDAASPPGVTYRTLALNPAADDFLGQVHLQASDQVGAVLWQRGNGPTLNRLRVATPDAVVADVIYQFGDNQTYAGLLAIPLGPCAQHPDASPLLVSVYRMPFSAWSVFVVDIDDPTVTRVQSEGEPTPAPLYSRCVSDPNGAAGGWLRLLVESATVDGVSGLWLTDLGPGLEQTTWAEILNRRRQFIPGAEALLTLGQPDGHVLPVLLMNRGVDVALFEVTLLGASSSAILALGSLLRTLPQVPKRTFYGSIASTGADVVALLTLGSSTSTGILEDKGPQWLHFATGGGASGPGVVGIMPLPECLMAVACEMRVLDLDADGLQEIVVVPAQIALGASALGISARIIHLGHR